MADSKLSALTELATTPATTDELYINDGGTSKKITWANLISGTPAVTAVELGHATDTTITRVSAGVLAVEGATLAVEADVEVSTINADTTTALTAALTDRGQTITMSNASANVLTIPANAAVAFDVGTVISVIMLGAGTTSITGDTGVTLNGVSAGSGAMSAQYGGVSLLKTATDTWVASGAIGTVA